MRKLTIMEHISLDGVIQHSADDDDFPYSDWTAPYRTPAGRDAILAAYGERFDLLLGRRTYDIWSGFWPKAPGSPLADSLNAATKYIATHRPESLEWSPFEGLGPDIVKNIRRIKSQDGPDLILSGSSTLTSPLLEHGLMAASMAENPSLLEGFLYIHKLLHNGSFTKGEIKVLALTCNRPSSPSAPIREWPV